MIGKLLVGNIKKVVFSSYCPLTIWTLKTCNKDISKTITACSYKIGKLIEYEPRHVISNNVVF